MESNGQPEREKKKSLTPMQNDMVSLLPGCSTNIEVNMYTLFISCIKKSVAVEYAL